MPSESPDLWVLATSRIRQRWLLGISERRLRFVWAPHLALSFESTRRQECTQNCRKVMSTALQNIQHSRWPAFASSDRGFGCSLRRSD
jgi:hypothetical protein